MQPIPRGREQRRRQLGQNFLTDSTVVRALVQGAGLTADDLAVDVGAGRGAITAELAPHVREVLAVERDPGLVAGLRRRFAGVANVGVVAADAVTYAWPAQPFRVVANIPFTLTTAILDSLLGAPGLVRADLVVQWEVARKRSSDGGNLRNAVWGPWFEFTAVRRISSTAFRPRPSVDAGVLVVRRRSQPWLAGHDRVAYAEFVTLGFTGRGATARQALTPVFRASEWAGAAALLSIPADARAKDLTVAQWVGLFSARRAGAAGRAPHPGERGARSPARPPRVVRHGRSP